MKTLAVDSVTVEAHFNARAAKYNVSSRWCRDDALLAKGAELAKPRSTESLLDVAVGTGFVSRFFRPLVSRVVGIDSNREMAKQATDAVDELHIGKAEQLPFDDGTFDLVTCRQGIQFMDTGRALAEMVRVLKPGGRVLLLDLCAYGESDSSEYFEILRLRNPARRNFFIYGDVAALLTRAGCERVETRPYVSVEDVELWADNGAIDEAALEAIRNVYRRASSAFIAHHAVQKGDERITDHMLFSISVGWTPERCKSTTLDGAVLA